MFEKKEVNIGYKKNNISRVVDEISTPLPPSIVKFDEVVKEIEEGKRKPPLIHNLIFACRVHKTPEERDACMRGFFEGAMFEREKHILKG